VILIPGVLVGYVLYDMIRPRRGVAVSNSGVAELQLSGVNGRPKSVIEVAPHSMLSGLHAPTNGGKVGLRFGGETVEIRGKDVATLVAAVPAPFPPPPH